MKRINRKEITIDIIKEFLDYDPDTGSLWWKKRQLHHFKQGNRQANACSIWNNKHAGTVAGSDDGKGRIIIRIYKNTYFAHRLAFMIMTGREPVEQIDHINGDSYYNKWINLRECEDYQNKQNLSIKSNNTSGYIGVWWHKQNKKWCAEIRTRNVKYYLGTFDDPKEAYEAYLAAKQNLHTFQPTPRNTDIT
jgi:hypothetical protein